VPDLPGGKDIGYLTSSSMMDVDFLPAHLIVVGGSYVGLEFAQMYKRFGSQVTVVEMSDRLVTREDDDVSAAIKAILEKEGIDMRLKAECIAFKRHSGGVAMRLACSEEPKEIVGTHVLLAVGRRPNTHDLGLDKAGVRTDAQGYVVVDEGLRTNVEGIFAVGDVNGRGAFTHTSFNDYQILVANMFEGETRRVSDRIPAYGLFVDPPLGRVGMTEREVRQSGRHALMATMPMTRVGRARERSETDGFMKILVDAETKEVLGASILGIEGDEVVQSILNVMYARAPYTAISRGMHIHPTVTELVPTLLESLQPFR
jgi:pyruvate/2-oxoglutarate dehydrogenase complex dihydrolipoamide dehydrogenase (E3) component